MPCQSDAAEFIARTDARDQNSYLRIIRYETNEDQTMMESTLEFTSSDDRIYEIFQTGDLRSPIAWQSSALGRFPGEAQTTLKTITLPNTSRHFFRVSAYLPLAGN